MVLGVILGTALCILGIFGAIFIIDAVPILKSYEDYVIVSIITLTLLVLWALTKKYVVQKSKITLKNDLLIFQRKSYKKELRISDIESYKYKFVQGVRLVIWTRYNEKIVIHANDYFCAYEELELFCLDFDHYVGSLNFEFDKSSSNLVDRDTLITTVQVEEKPTNPVSEKLDSKSPSSIKPQLGNQIINKETHNQIPERKRSFYERKYALPVLVSFTVVGIIFIIYVKMDGGNLPGTFIVGVGGISAMWMGYLNHQKK